VHRKVRVGRASTEASLPCVEGGTSAATHLRHRVRRRRATWNQAPSCRATRPDRADAFAMTETFLESTIGPAVIATPRTGMLRQRGRVVTRLVSCSRSHGE